MTPSALHAAWQHAVAIAAVGITAATPAEVGRPDPLDYAGVGFIGGWLFASRFAGRHPELAARLLEELEAEEPRGPEQVATEERLMAMMARAG